MQIQTDEGLYAIESEKREGHDVQIMHDSGSVQCKIGAKTVNVCQVNLDFESEADMIEKFRIGLALQPIATAIFANSPFEHGKPNGCTNSPSPLTPPLHQVFEFEKSDLVRNRSRQMWESSLCL